MMTRKQMIAEIQSTLRPYDDAGLLDYRLLNMWIKKALKEFGGNGMVGEELTIKVENGKAKLPDNFYSLALAIRCDLLGVYVEEEDKVHKQTVNFYQETTEVSLDWDNTLGERPCVKGVDCKAIVEEVYFIQRGGGIKVPASLYYNNIRPLTLKRGWNKNNCDYDCPNLNLPQSDSEISIQGDYLQTNADFTDGFIFMRYRGIPTDDEGDLIIGETDRDNLVEYVKYVSIRKSLQELLTKGDEPNIVQLYQLYRGLEDEAYLAAKNDLTNAGLLNWRNAIKKNNRVYTRKFEVMIPNI
jgi:hypothetical protein